MNNPLIIVGNRWEEHRQFCHYALGTTQDTLFCRHGDSHRLQGLRNCKWVRLCPGERIMNRRLYEEFLFHVKERCFQFVDQRDWHTLAPEYVRLQELQIELDKTRALYRERVAFQENW